jgi:hypothetical protein
MERAYSPYLSRYSVPGALPQAGMERAFRRSFLHTDGIFIYAESAAAAIPVVYQMEIRVRNSAQLPLWLGAKREYQAPAADRTAVMGIAAWRCARKQVRIGRACSS